MRVEQYDPKFNNDLVELINDFHHESLFEYDDLVSKDVLLKTVVDSGSTNLENIFVMTVDGICRGVMYGVCSQSPINGQVVFQEVMWFIKEPYRRYGIKLLKEVENILKSRGVRIMIMAVMENSKTHKLDRFYKRMGYKPMERHYVRTLNGLG